MFDEGLETLTTRDQASRMVQHVALRRGSRNAPLHARLPQAGLEREVCLLLTMVGGLRQGRCGPASER